ncbi:anthranilate phosphoribosyltransferase [Thioalkalivibrio sp. XN279]|uniref:anthranilate phosphoribosyltransferase n=1 Tax=Thioalkalivibrio sp. XN279 TaxID=2714953 RepID=UPI0014099123|nr:anthranilate phosphoribosyltransferase [Thioalkalivibrio sp. XN279]NHA13745.1 anthranilate phosphoribosyltransferase [Thioalkalivibrio sp. XN279]
MKELTALLEKLLARVDLDEDEAGQLMVALTREDLPPALAAALLVALRAKGETAAEVRGFARAMRGLARKPTVPADAPLLDIVGTGGDGSGSLNISTGASLLAAACGIPVVKHGNRSVSSRSGSADVLEALGMRLPADAAEAGACLAATGYTFLFAPHFHPAMKAVAPVRKAMGVRTVFNLLGPLTNPAAPPYLLLGAFSPAAARLMAEALAGFEGLARAFVVHGSPGWDEATPVGPFVLYEVCGEEVSETTRDPAEWGLARCTAEDLAGGDATVNATRLRAALAGEDTGPHLDALLLGTALALELTGRADSPANAIGVARAAVEDGRARALLEALACHGREASA